MSGLHDPRSGIMTGVLLLALVGCARAPLSKPAPVADLTRNARVVLNPLPTAALKIETSGQVGPLMHGTSLDRGYAEYDEGLQSSLFLCGGFGPAAGPCLAVLGSLYAVAGAASSVAYHLREHSTQATAVTADALTQGTPPTMLSAQIAARTAAIGRAAGSAWSSTEFAVATPCAAPDDQTPVMVVNLAVAEIKVQFEVGYQFKLTIVVRVQPQHCTSREPMPVRRLAYIGQVLPLSRDPTRAVAALDAEIAQATTTLAQDTADYLRGAR